MKHLICLITAISLAAGPHIVSAQDQKGGLDAMIKELGEKFIKDKQAVGLSIGVYNNGNARFYNFGSIQRNKTTLPTQHTVYEIGSITKTFISYILANAVLDNKVSLDDDIRKYLEGKYPNLEYNGHPIRLVHLANTTSLLPDWLPGVPAEIKKLSPDSASIFKINYYKKLTSRDFFHALHSVALDTAPGTKVSHSNAGAQLLAYILEGVYDMSMEMLIKKYITTPYSLRNTSLISSKHPAKIATGYTASGKKAMYESAIPYFNYAGGLGSTCYDLINYVKLLLDTTNHAVALSLHKTVDIDASSGKVADMRPDNTAAPEIYSTALTWLKYQPSDSSAQIWSDGGTNGFNSYLVIYPKLKSGIVILANKSDEKIFRALPGIAYEISKMLAQKK